MYITMKRYFILILICIMIPQYAYARPCALELRLTKFQKQTADFFNVEGDINDDALFERWSDLVAIIQEFQRMEDFKPFWNDDFIESITNFDLQYINYKTAATDEKPGYAKAMSVEYTKLLNIISEIPGGFASLSNKAIRTAERVANVLAHFFIKLDNDNPWCI